MAKQSYIATSEGQLAVREAIAYHGFTQQQLAVAANLRTRSSISKLINGKPVERQIFQRICQCLELDFRAIAGLQLSASVDEIKKVQSASMPNSESSTDSVEWILSELNNLKVTLQALMSVPSALEALNAHIQLLSRSIAQDTELLAPQSDQDIEAPLTLPTLREPIHSEGLIRKVELDTPLEKVEATPLTLPEVPKMDEQIESCSDENVLEPGRLLFPPERLRLAPSLERGAQEDLSKSDNEQPDQVSEPPLLSSANPVASKLKEPLKRPVSPATTSEKESSKPPQAKKFLARWWEGFGGK